MKYLRTVLVASFLLLAPFAGIFVGPLKIAHADATCTIVPADLDAVKAAAAQGLLAELAARKALLTRTITCAKAEAQSLQNNLNALRVNDSEKTLQSQFSGKLDDAMNYYDLELTKAGNAGIAGTQGIAREVLAWRAGTYDPLAAQVANFMLWEKNQNLFAIAAGRLHAMENFVSFLEEAGAQNDLRADLAGAQALIQSANNENQAAKNAFIQSLPPDQSFALIQQSLQSLSDAYQTFFDMSTIIQKLLPTKNP